jgi:hypothetical protein
MAVGNCDKTSWLVAAQAGVHVHVHVGAGVRPKVRA